MNIRLNDVEVRVLGSLVEKGITTPDYYPLSLNALVDSCNQKSNREPLMHLDEDAVRQAVDSLSDKGLAGTASGADSRVTKYAHHLQETFNLDRRETAILCVLLLRGPQTPGELRARTERLHRFEDLAAVESALQHLMLREPPLAKGLPRQAGTKEQRYTHLLSGDVEAGEPRELTTTGGRSLDDERIARLESQVADLQREVGELKRQLTAFRKQFE